MALISCMECNSQISDQAVSCPSCGFPMKPVVATQAANVGRKGLPHRLTERFSTNMSIPELREKLAAKLHAHDAKFDVTELVRKQSGVVTLEVNITKQGSSCLVIVDHMHGKSSQGRGGALVLVLILCWLIWIFLSEWVSLAILVIAIWGHVLASRELNIEQIQACLKSLRDECIAEPTQQTPSVS